MYYYLTIPIIYYYLTIPIVAFNQIYYYKNMSIGSQDSGGEEGRRERQRDVESVAQRLAGIPNKKNTHKAMLFEFLFYKFLVACAR